MSMYPPVICFACTRLDRTPAPITGAVAPIRCGAYPDAIPDEIRQGADHRVPRGDEHEGLVFEQIPTTEAVSAFDRWTRVQDRVRAMLAADPE